MIDALLDLPPHLRDRLANALEAGVVTTPYSLASLRAILGSTTVGEDLVAALLEMQRHGVAGSAAGTLIRAVSEVARRSTKPDVVWSGPEVPGLHARDTRRVFDELLGQAQRSIWASTYA